MTETNNSKSNKTKQLPQISSTKNTTETKKTQIKKQVNNNAFKQKYFEFYDDVKTHNNGPYDW